jgi:hypothetical protein
MNAMLNAQMGNVGQLAQLDLRTATAGQLQDAARRRHAELTEKRAKLIEEVNALGNEIQALGEMLPKGGEK